jgi:hypothetical protein
MCCCNFCTFIGHTPLFEIIGNANLWIVTLCYIKDAALLPKQGHLMSGLLQLGKGEQVWFELDR